MTIDKSQGITRIAPRPWLGVLVFIAYLAVFCTIWAINGVDYAHLSDNADTVARWIVAPLVGGAIVLIVAMSVLGWWRPALVETKKRYPAWMWIFPGAMVVLAVVGIVLGDHTHVTPAMWLLLVVAGILVGFNEELLTRGQAIVALRARFGEVGVWAFSTLLFSLLHVPNMFFGTGPAGILQVGVTFLMGSMLYLTRRVAGSLFIAMFVHGLWDFSSFAGNGEFGGLIAISGWILGVVAVIVAAIHTKRETREARAAVSA
ncbi:MAG: CPBP family intramembrane metalloprotease [Microbacterium sp.]|jgi:membrane protease YdiL (CAAX protease family)|nr:CPBP family intramembrane metalloprotease [Microbacterium sp.]